MCHLRYGTGAARIGLDQPLSTRRWISAPQLEAATPTSARIPRSMRENGVFGWDDGWDTFCVWQRLRVEASTSKRFFDHHFATNNYFRQVREIGASISHFVAFLYVTWFLRRPNFNAACLQKLLPCSFLLIAMEHTPTCTTYGVRQTSSNFSGSLSFARGMHPSRKSVFYNQD